MAYTRIVQYGDITEVYEYDKDFNFNRRKTHFSKQKKARIKKAREIAISKGFKTDRSIKRTTKTFFRLVHANNCKADTISFLTLTFSYDVTETQASLYTKVFFRKLKDSVKDVPLSFISVPERTEKGRIHYHILLYNLPTQKIKTERNTRFIQRLFGRGYVDIRLAKDKSPKIAGYMAKYMAKAMRDTSFKARRLFSTSRNIEKVASAGSNSLFADPLILKELSPSDGALELSIGYNVPYLGNCQFRRFKK